MAVVLGALGLLGVSQGPKIPKKMTVKQIISATRGTPRNPLAIVLLNGTLIVSMFWASMVLSFPSGTSLLIVHPRIDVGIENIYDQVDSDKQHREDQRESLYYGEVTGKNRGHG